MQWHWDPGQPPKPNIDTGKELINVDEAAESVCTKLHAIMDYTAVAA